jgi:hypothetical protein
MSSITATAITVAAMAPLRRGGSSGCALGVARISDKALWSNAGRMKSSSRGGGRRNVRAALPGGTHGLAVAR